MKKMISSQVVFAVGVPMPRGFHRVAVGYKEMVVRKTDGADLNLLHRASTCPTDCPLCVLRARHASGVVPSNLIGGGR